MRIPLRGTGVRRRIGRAGGLRCNTGTGLLRGTGRRLRGRILAGNTVCGKVGSVSGIDCLESACKVSQRGVPVDSHLVRRVTALLVGICGCGLTRAVIIALPFGLGSNILAAGLRATHEHSRNRGRHAIRSTRAVMRMHRGLRAKTGHERYVERVLAKQVIEHLERGGVVFFLAGEVVGMQQPHALIGRHSVGAPHKVILRHHDAKTGLGAVYELVCRLENVLLGLARIAEYGGVRCLAVGCDTLHVAPVRDVLRGARLLVRTVACGNREFCCRKEFLVCRIGALIIACRDIGRVRRKMHVHVVAAPGISLLCRFQALARITRIEGLVHARGHSHHAREIECGLGALADNVKFGIVLRRHHVAREPEGSELVVDAAVTCLHGEHPVQVPLDFGEQVR